MKRIYVATSNPHKIEEISHITRDLGIDVLPVSEICDPVDVVEDGVTFEENAAKKAVTHAELCGETVIADDSGLQVHALDNEPGIHSARYAGEECDYEKNNQLIIRNLHDKGLDSSPAAFVCVIAMKRKDQDDVLFFHGTCSGKIVDTPRGSGGFGYDPLFIAHGQAETFAEMDSEKKNTISHRHNALNQLRNYLSNEVVQ